MFRTPNVRRNVADNMRRTYAMSADISNEDILDLVEELSFMDADEMHFYLLEEHERLGSWQHVIAHNAPTPVTILSMELSL